LRDGEYAYEQKLVHRLCDALVEALRRYPNDAELAFLHAEVRAEYDRDVVIGEVDDRGTLARYDKAIALDSGFAPAYVTPIRFAAFLDGARSAQRYIHAYLALAPSGSRSGIIRLAGDLLDPARAASINVARLVDSLPADAICAAAQVMRHVPDSAEFVRRAARALVENHRLDTLAGASRHTCLVSQLVNGLQFRGHLREAERLATLDAHGLRAGVIYNMSRFSMLPVDSTRAEFHQILALAPRVRMTTLYGWWATDGDTAAIRTYIDGFWAEGARLRTASVDALLRANIVAGRAYLALARRDTAAALRELVTTRDTLHHCWSENRVTIVKLLSAAGRDREAAHRLERRWPGTTSCSNGVDDVLWTMERARVFNRLGRRDEAATNYQFVIDAWRTADPELQPYVREATAALKRLRQNGARVLASSD
jgi:serine/threonine-protein kinase